MNWPGIRIRLTLYLWLKRTLALPKSYRQERSHKFLGLFLVSAFRSKFSPRKNLAIITLEVALTSNHFSFRKSCAKMRRRKSSNGCYKKCFDFSFGTSLRKRLFPACVLCDVDVVTNVAQKQNQFWVLTNQKPKIVWPYSKGEEAFSRLGSQYLGYVKCKYAARWQH